MQITIEIETDNAAFDDSREIERILKALAKKIANGQNDGRIMDINGNSVGKFTVEN